ncbi:hypothetical protein [Yinghuangia aomiensis]
MTEPSYTDPAYPEPPSGPPGYAEPVLSPPLWFEALDEARAEAAPRFGSAPPAATAAPNLLKPPPVPVNRMPMAPPPVGLPDPPVAAPRPAPGAPPIPADPDAEDLFGWDFDQSAAAEPLWPDEQLPPWRKLWFKVTVVVTVLLVAGVAAVFVLADDPKEAPPPPAPSQAPAVAVDPQNLAALQPRDVAAAAYEGRLQVTWSAPERTDGVVGYFAASQTPAGDLLDRVLVDNGELVAVFSGPAAAADACVVVTTVVRGEPALMLAKSEPVCPGKPASPAPSGGASPAPGASAPAGSAPASAPPASAPPASAPAGAAPGEGSSDDQMMPGTVPGE